MLANKLTLCDSCALAEISVEFRAQTVIRYWECDWHADAGINKVECEDYEAVEQPWAH